MSSVRPWRLSIVFAAALSCASAGSDGEPVLYLLGNVPQRAEWIGAYERQGPSKLAKKGLVDGRHYYAKRGDTAKFMWYNKHSGRWYVGKSRALGHAAGVLHVSDSATLPEQITSNWQVWHGPQRGWVAAPELKVMSSREGRTAMQAEAAVLASTPQTIMLAGQTPSGVRHEWLGVYLKQQPTVNGRHSFVKQSDSSKMVWYSNKVGTWYVGPEALLGAAKGVLMAPDMAVSPHQIKPGIWTVGQGEGKGWVSAPELRCLHGSELSAALATQTRSLEASPRTVYLIARNYKPAARSISLPPQWQGAYTVITKADGTDVVKEGRYSYSRAGRAGERWSLWHDGRRGTWYISHQRSGRQASMKAKNLFSSYDGAQLPQQIKVTWRRSSQGSWTTTMGSPESIKVVAGEEGEAILREQFATTSRALAQAAEVVLLTGLAASATHHEWLGIYHRRGATLVHGRHVYVHSGDARKVLWFDVRSESWCIALHEAVALQQLRFFPNRAVLRAVDAALTPEAISGAWMKRDEGSGHGEWSIIPGFRCVAAHEREGQADLRLRQQAVGSAESPVYLVGSTPPAFSRTWMGAYERHGSAASSASNGTRPTYRGRRDRTKVLSYNEPTGEWRAQMLDEASGQPVTFMSAYDGAFVPEHIVAAWRVRADIGWEDAPEVRSRVGVEGRLALEADEQAGRAADALRKELKPGWFFAVKKVPVLAALRLALQSGVRPATAYALLSTARADGVDATVLEAARQQLTLATPPDIRSSRKHAPFSASAGATGSELRKQITDHVSSQLSAGASPHANHSAIVMAASMPQQTRKGTRSLIGRRGGRAGARGPGRGKRQGTKAPFASSRNSLGRAEKRLKKHKRQMPEMHAHTE